MSAAHHKDFESTSVLGEPLADGFEVFFAHLADVDQLALGLGDAAPVELALAGLPLESPEVEVADGDQHRVASSSLMMSDNDAMAPDTGLGTRPQEFLPAPA